jgi:hypothetical protein
MEISMRSTQSWSVDQLNAGHGNGTIFSLETAFTISAGGTAPWLIQLEEDQMDQQTIWEVEDLPRETLRTARQVPAAEPDESGLQGSMFSVGDSPARTTRLQDSAADWLATAALSGGNFSGSLTLSAPPGSWARMSPGSSVVGTGLTLRQSSGRLPNAGMAWPGRCLTLNTSEYRNGAVVSSLSDILEASPDPRYLLSPRACSGILYRAEQRGKDLPPALKAALERVAQTSEEE